MPQKVDFSDYDKILANFDDFLKKQFAIWQSGVHVAFNLSIFTTISEKTKKEI